MLHESSFYNKLYEENGDNVNESQSSKLTVQCNLCRRYCKIKNNNSGFCNTQKNIGGKLYSCNYHRIASYHIDPIEKKAFVSLLAWLKHILYWWFWM